MVKLMAGAPGSGKTKVLIQMANEAAGTAKGEVVFVDIADKHSSMLDRKIRLVYTDEFNINSLKSLYGLLCGMISANRDVEGVYIDGLDKVVTNSLVDELPEFLDVVDDFTKKNDVNVVISASIEDAGLLEKVAKFQ